MSDFTQGNSGICSSSFSRFMVVPGLKEVITPMPEEFINYDLVGMVLFLYDLIAQR